MSSRPYVSPKAVCRAMVLAVARRAVGEKNFTLSMALQEIPGESIRYGSPAVSEAIKEGLVIRTPKGYRLTEKGRAEIAQEPEWQPKPRR